MSTTTTNNPITSRMSTDNMDTNMDTASSTIKVIIKENSKESIEEIEQQSNNYIKEIMSILMNKNSNETMKLLK